MNTTLDIIEDHLKRPRCKAYLATTSSVSRHEIAHFIGIWDKYRTSQEKIFLKEDEVPLVKAMMEKYDKINKEKIKIEKEKRRLKKEAKLNGEDEILSTVDDVVEETQEIADLIEEHILISKVKEKDIEELEAEYLEGECEDDEEP